MNILKAKKGFTLIELLVVIAIIGILAALIIVSLTSARGRAQDTQRKNNARSLDTALAQYYVDQTTSVYPSNSDSEGVDGVPIGDSSACAAPLSVLVGTSGYLTASTSCGDPTNLAHLYATAGTGATYSIGWQLANQTESTVTTGNGVYAVAGGVINVGGAHTPDFTAGSGIAGTRAFVVYGPQ